MRLLCNNKIVIKNCEWLNSEVGKNVKLPKLQTFYSRLSKAQYENPGCKLGIIEIPSQK